MQKPKKVIVFEDTILSLLVLMYWSKGKVFGEAFLLIFNLTTQVSTFSPQQIHLCSKIRVTARHDNLYKYWCYKIILFFKKGSWQPGGAQSEVCWDKMRTKVLNSIFWGGGDCPFSPATQTEWGTFSIYSTAMYFGERCSYQLHLLISLLLSSFCAPSSFEV